jgi:hypothetical protein
MQRTILYSLILVSGLLLGIGLFRYYPYVASFVSFDDRFKSVSLEAGKAGKIELSRTEQPRALFLFVPDRRMDRRWNTTHLETRVGLKLGQILNERSVDTAVFDRKDAGLPPDHYVDPQTIAEQIRDAFVALQAYRDSQKIYEKEKSPITILAHGDGCLATLLAVDAYGIEPEKIMLFGCAYDGTLLESYGEMITNAMHLTGVDEKVMTTVKKEWADWLNQKEYEELTEEQWLELQKAMLKEKVNQDLVAFRRTRSVFQRPHNREWLLRAKRLSYVELVESVLKKSRVVIEHFASQYDEELPPDLIERNAVRAKTFGPRYTFAVLSQTDHFLFEKDSPPASPVENMMSRSNPFKSLSPAFLNVIEERYP